MEMQAGHKQANVITTTIIVRGDVVVFNRMEMWVGHEWANTIITTIIVRGDVIILTRRKKLTKEIGMLE